MSNVNPTGGVAIAHLWTNAVYDPATEGPITGIGATFDGRFLGGSEGTSQYGFQLYFEQDGSRYVASNLMWFATAEGPGNGQQGSWTNFLFPVLDSSQFRLQSGGGPANPDLAATGAPITFGIFTTTAASSIPVSITGGVDNLTFLILGTNDSDLAVSKIADHSTIDAGSNLTYTITVTNLGAVAATDVTVTDELPAGVTFVSASPGCTHIGGDVVCDLGSLATGDGTSVTVIVTPNNPGVITNSVTVSSAETDVVPEDNTDAVVTTVQEAGTDLSPLIENTDISCTNTDPGSTCSLTGELSLRNSGVAFATAQIDFSALCKKCPEKLKWKLAGFITLETLDLTGVPDHSLAIYLSNDDTLDAGDTLLVKKPIGILGFAKAFSGGKPIKVKTKMPSDTDLSGKYLILVQDSDDAVNESNETNNAVAIGPVS